ncbi:hypothetical protein ACFQ6N_17275 [Kitasatospora sp. NPDC056446]|uniref:hypothetical protein n=1 Tax=Kitasatospora sp. NPDC056446 TaxID=3345819 RepID=UPI003679E55C
MSNQSRHSRSNEPDAVVGDALRQAESTVVVNGADLDRRREALLSWMADRIETDPESPADGATTAAGATHGPGAELGALVTVAATVVVHLMATNHWERAQPVISRLWGRGHPERAGRVLAELEESRVEVLEARETGDEEAVQGLVSEWRTRLRRLVSTSPEAADELRRLLQELTPAGAPHPTLSITGSRSTLSIAQVYQGGVGTSRH